LLLALKNFASGRIFSDNNFLRGVFCVNEIAKIIDIFKMILAIHFGHNGVLLLGTSIIDER
jgi:hypothetical protein